MKQSRMTHLISIGIDCSWQVSKSPLPCEMQEQSARQAAAQEDAPIQAQKVADAMLQEYKVGIR